MQKKDALFSAQKSVFSLRVRTVAKKVKNWLRNLSGHLGTIRVLSLRLRTLAAEANTWIWNLFEKSIFDKMTHIFY